MTAPATPLLGPLIRKAAIDAGFDLEPERDGAWWRLRSSGAPGVVWVHGDNASSSGGPAVLLALPLTSQIAELGLPAIVDPSAPAPPMGAASAVACDSPYALHAALRRIWTMRVNTPARLQARLESETAAAIRAALPPDATNPVGIPADAPLVTEAIAEVRRRIGQDLYREALLDFWEGRCAVTGLAVPELLRASHAKPWAASTDAERLDVHNGLLLAVHLDALFDRGLMTFGDDGAAIFSPFLTDEARQILAADGPELRLRSVSPAHLPYLEYHRTHVFRS